MNHSKLLRQRDALVYLLKHVDRTEKDKEIHREALNEIEKLIKEDK